MQKVDDTHTDDDNAEGENNKATAGKQESTLGSVEHQPRTKAKANACPTSTVPTRGLHVGKSRQLRMRCLSRP